MWGNVKRILLSVLASASVLSLTSAHAALTIFTDRSAYLSALGGSLVEETFDSILVDTHFRNTTVQFDHFSVGYSGVIRSSTFNFIDAGAPNSVNNTFGSTALVGGVGPGEPLTFALTSPAYAFGGDWARINDTVARSVFDVAGEQVDPGLDLDGFFGVVSTTAFSTFTVLGIAFGEGFGLDNVAISFDPIDNGRPVPVPAAGLLFAGGAFAAYRRHKAKRA